MQLPARLAPVTFVFQLRSGSNVELHNALGPHFAVPVGMVPGDATRLGKALCRLCLSCLAAHACETCCTLSSQHMPWRG